VCPAAGRPRSSTSTWGRSVLQKHEGHYRFFDFAVPDAQLGIAYGLKRSSNAIDLPFPQKVSQLIERQLESPDSRRSNISLVISTSGMTGHGTPCRVKCHPLQELRERPRSSICGCPRSAPILPALTARRSSSRNSENLAASMRCPTRERSLDQSSSCTVTTANVNNDDGSTAAERWFDAHSDRTHHGRLEGVPVNGKAVTIKTVDHGASTRASTGPGGTSTVTYSFLPPHEKYAFFRLARGRSSWWSCGSTSGATHAENDSLADVNAFTISACIAAHLHELM